MSLISENQNSGPGGAGHDFNLLEDEPMYIEDAAREGVLTCGMCTFDNPLTATMCEVCGNKL